jgi:NADH-quinone oxidoreductase subunit M
VPVTVVASLGILASTFYALRMVQRAFLGPDTHAWRLSDLSPREGLMVGTMIAGLLWLGLYPQPVLNTVEPALQTLQQETQASTAALRR